MIPNALWGSVLVAVTTIVNQYYGDMVWAPVAVAVLVMIGKLIQVSMTSEPAETTRSLGEQEQPSKLRRWLIG